MRILGQDQWAIQYKAFINLVKNDFPYPLEEHLFDAELEGIFKDVYADLIDQHSKTEDPYFSQNGQGILDLAYLDHYLILCYWFANALHLNTNKNELADAIYYSCRTRTSTDIFYRSEIGKFFHPIHPIGTVIDSKASYGVGLRLYNDIHIGPYGIDGKPPSEWIHPKIGDGVIIYAKSCIYGKSVIGNNVTISPGTIIVNETIPDNCVLFGQSPNLKAVPNKHDNMGIFDI